GGFGLQTGHCHAPFTLRAGPQSLSPKYAMVPLTRAPYAARSLTNVMKSVSLGCEGEFGGYGPVAKTKPCNAFGPLSPFTSAPAFKRALMHSVHLEGLVCHIPIAPSNGSPSFASAPWANSRLTNAGVF